MNSFILVKHNDGSRELITPELDGLVLPGITRQSVLDFVKEMGDVKISVRKIHIDEVLSLHKSGNVSL